MAFRDKALEQLANSEDWFPYGLVRSFLMLVRHQFHNPKTMLLDAEMGLTGAKEQGAISIAREVERMVILLLLMFVFFTAQVGSSQQEGISQDAVEILTNSGLIDRSSGSATQRVLPGIQP